MFVLFLVVFERLVVSNITYNDVKHHYEWCMHVWSVRVSVVRSVCLFIIITYLTYLSPCWASEWRTVD